MGSPAREEDAGFIWANLVVWPLQSIAAFPYRNQMGPIVVYPVVMALVIGLLLLGVRRGSPREERVVVGSLVVALGLPVVLTVLTLEQHGNIWQGRYGLPYAVGFVILAGYVVGVHARPDERLPWRLTVLAVVPYGVAVSACLIKVRANELSDNPASRGDPAWHQPAPVLLALLVTFAMLSAAVALSGGSRTVP
jgi:xanthine/uracil permease